MQNRVVEEEGRRISPTLLVGLGGTGREIITRIRRNFVGKYDSVSNFPIVGYFLVDTDTTMQDYTPGLKSIVERRINFSENETYMATVNNVSQYTQRLNLFPHLKEWLYPNLADIGDLTAGAGAIRPYGRLAFFVHQATIRRNLADALGAIRSPDRRNMVAENYNIQCSPQVSAYIVCSLAGGTGSSMFLDMAFTLKDIARSQGMTLEIIGFLIMPGIYGEDKHYANGYAALKELEHHSRTNSFRVRYEPNTNEKIIPVPPFDYCYLVHNENEAGITLDFSARGDMFEMLAENIFLDFSNDDFAAQKRRNRVNFADQVSEVYSSGIAGFGLDEEEGWSKRYMSFGYTSISYPADRIIGCCAYKLAGEIFTAWGKLADPQKDFAGISLSNFVYDPGAANQGFLADLGMYESMEESGKHDIIDWITRPGSGSSNMLEDIRAWAGRLEGQVKDDAHMRHNMTIVQFLNQEAKLFAAKFISSDQEPDASKRGEFDRRMDENLKVLLYGGRLAGSEESVTGLIDQTVQSGEAIRGKIRNHVARMINDRTFSSAHMMQVLREVVRRLRTGDDSYKASLLRQMGDEQADTGLQRDMKEYEKQANSFLSKIDSLLGEREQHRSWGEILPWNKMRKNAALRYDEARIDEVLSGYTQSLVAYFHTKARLLARSKALNAYDQVIDYIDGSLIPELERVRETIKTLHTQATSSADQLRGKIEVSLLHNIYDPGDIDDIYYPMGSSVDNINYQSDRAVDVLSDMRGSRATIVDLPEMADRFSMEEVMSTVISYTRSVFEPVIRNLNIIEEVYEKKFPESESSKRRLFLRNSYDYGKCWMVLNRTLPNLRIDPGNHRSYIVGRHADPSKRQTYDLFDREMQRMRDGTLDPQVHFFQTSDPAKILISTELAGFPLPAFSGINTMKEKYEVEYMKMGSTLHIDKNDFKYRDIVPILDEVDLKRIEDIRSCFVFGTILGVLNPKTSEDDSQIVYEFIRDTHLRPIPMSLGVESKARVALERNPQMLKDIKEEIMRREGVLLRQRDGAFGDGFRNYYLTIFWYWENVYAAQEIDVGGGQRRRRRSVENQILERKMDELAGMYKRTWDIGEAESRWNQFKQEALRLLNRTDEYSEQVESTRLRVVKM